MSDHTPTRFTPVRELLRAHAALCERIEILSGRKSEVESFLRQKISRTLWGYDRPVTPHILDDAESGLREQFPGLCEQLGVRSYREAAEWLIRE